MKNQGVSLGLGGHFSFTQVLQLGPLPIAG
jgi:hypothetical protein